MRILLTGGGTGGHIYPGLTLAEAIRAKAADAEFLFVGRATGLEADVVRGTGMAYAAIDSGGMAGLSVLRRAAGAWRAAHGVVKALGILGRFRPDVVVGCGGFVAGPMLLAACLCRTPSVVLESDVNPGAVSRIAARWARAVFVSHEAARPNFPAGTPLQALGVPVRQTVLATSRAEGRRALGYSAGDRVVLVVAGSGGAPAIHSAVIAAAPQLLSAPEVQVLHVSGQRYFAELKKEYAAAGIDLDKPGRLRLVPYLYNIAEAYAAADLAVTRAGASILAELTARGLPAVIIPSPNVARNHQEANARVLADAGAAVLLREAELSGARLAGTVSQLLGDAAALQRMAVASRSLGRPEAAAAIAEQVVRLAHSGGKGRS